MSIGKRRTFTEALQGMDPGLKHNSGNMAVGCNLKWLPQVQRQARAKGITIIGSLPV